MVLKETADSISLPLYILFTKSINAGTLPAAWKQGHVTPIYKKGPRCLVQNYRPITLTSIIGKILESIIRDALLNHFNHHSLLNANQHGFVPKRSCTSQLLMVLEDWTRAIQRNSYSDVIFWTSARHLTLFRTNGYFISSYLMVYRAHCLCG